MNFRKILFIAFIAFLNLTALQGQSFIKKMGAGVPQPVTCACTDSVGNIYTVSTSRPFSDTIVVNKWNVANRTWSVLTTLPKYTIGTPTRTTTCNILYGKLYVTLFSNPGYKYRLMEYNGSWKVVANITRSNYNLATNSTVFKNKVYFVGGFDSINGSYKPNVFSYNGSIIKNDSFPLNFISNGLFESDLTNSKDTLYMTNGKSIIYHVLPNKWGIYYQKPNTFINKIIFTNNGLLINSYNTLSSYPDSLSFISSSNIIKSKNYNDIAFAKNRIITFNRYNFRFSEVLINSKIEIRPFFNTNIFAYDTNFISFVAGANNKLYYFGSRGVKLNNIDFGNIVEIELDSIKHQTEDTILIRVFADKNKNLKIDGSDLRNYCRIKVNNSEEYTNSIGEYTYFPLDNEKVEFNYSGGFDFDTCFAYTQSFSGTINSKCFNSSITRDTLNIPLWGTSTTSKNIAIKMFAFNRVRLNDTSYMGCKILNYNCDNSAADATVKIHLDKDFTFTGSIPNYDSISNNTLTYNVNDIIGLNSKQILIKGVYPSNKYNIGESVKHYCEVFTSFTENKQDNSDTIKQYLVYSYDPNSKHSEPEGRITSDLKKIRYTINFQNEGNDDARRVTIVDTLNLKMPVYEFQMVSATHPYSVSIQPGTSVVTWTFDNINLKPKEQNEALSKGYLIFEAKVRGDLRVGDSIRNKAYIYFDYNTPILTNYAVISKVENKLSLEKTIVSKTLSLYPNPAQNYITINSKIDNQNITFYDMKGAMIETLKLDKSNETKLNVSQWAKGIYLLVSESGESLKFIVE